jgi:DNA replication and repair protein RecF
MKLDWIELRDFRSYRELRIEPDPGVNVFVGSNGSGKTNLLEAIAYLSMLRSFRGSPDELLIARGHEAAIVRGEVTRHDSRSRVEVSIGQIRKVLINGRRPTRISDMLGHLRVSRFLPDDLDIVKRGPAYRRGFLDDTALQLWPGFYGDIRDFERALRQRNALLKTRRPDRFTLQVWDDRLSHVGARLMERRAKAARMLFERVQTIYRRLSDTQSTVTLDYQSDWGGSIDEVGFDELRTRLKESLEDRHAGDLERRQTSVGPHRDDPVFVLEDLPARMAASQGEQRTLVLSLRLAAHETVTEAVGEMPILLLDDVFSELDETRTSALASALPATQTFITTARPEDVPVAGQRWDVGDGSIS